MLQQRTASHDGDATSLNISEACQACQTELQKLRLNDLHLTFGLFCVLVFKGSPPPLTPSSPLPPDIEYSFSLSEEDVKKIHKDLEKILSHRWSP